MDIIIAFIVFPAIGLIIYALGLDMFFQFAVCIFGIASIGAWLALFFTGKMCEDIR